MSNMVFKMNNMKIYPSINSEITKWSVAEQQPQGRKLRSTHRYSC